MPILGPFFLCRNRGKMKEKSLSGTMMIMTTPLFSASNYIITGSTGFETAKACAIVEDSRIEENLLSLDENHISTKSGESF